MSTLPNYLSMLRIALVVPIAWLLWRHQVMSAFWLMLLAGFTDALDGFLARRYSWQTELGSMLDPLADKFLVAAMYLVFTLHGLIPTWLVVLILGRDVLILLAVGAYRGIFGDLTVNPSLLSKANTAVQILVVLLLMVSQMPIGELGDDLLGLLQIYGFPVLTLLCVASGGHYLLVWGRHAWQRLGTEDGDRAKALLKKGDR
ncbi:MAG: CDP-alcohol phosphatidyltransferase family protein [Gammaproteobacteria bacterium]|jgi:cardiolipin synthase